MFYTVMLFCLLSVVPFIHGTNQITGNTADSFKANIFSYCGLSLHCGHKSFLLYLYFNYFLIGLFNTAEGWDIRILFAKLCQLFWADCFTIASAAAWAYIADYADIAANRVTVNRAAGKTTRYYVDEFHLLLKGELASWSVEIWKRFRKWGGIPTGITQNVKDLLSSREVENIFENSDFIYMLNQAAGDRQILAKQLNISPHQLSYVTHSGEGEGLLFYGNTILPFIDHFPKDTELYRVMTTKPQEVASA